MVVACGRFAFRAIQNPAYRPAGTHPTRPSRATSLARPSGYGITPHFGLDRRFPPDLGAQRDRRRRCRAMRLWTILRIAWTQRRITRLRVSPARSTSGSRPPSPSTLTKLANLASGGVSRRPRQSRSIRNFLGKERLLNPKRGLLDPGPGDRARGVSLTPMGSHAIPHHPVRQADAGRRGGPSPDGTPAFGSPCPPGPARSG